MVEYWCDHEKRLEEFKREMEKKTIGKFISALRRANGMTQRELAERLFVSDKTVSRWERDESVPEITLIPVIAEIFGVTSDELIRGERISAEKTECAETVERVSGKTEKSIRAILFERNKRHGNFLLLSLGLSFLGLIAAMIADLAFCKGLLAFCLSLAFIFAGEICVICFTRNGFLMLDDGDFSCGAREVKAYNSKVAGYAVRITVFNICSIAFCLPLVIVGANYGIYFGDWCMYGLLLVAVALAVTYICRVLWIDRVMISHGLTVTDEKTEQMKDEIRKKLIRVLAVFLCVEAVILGGLWFNYQFVFDLTVEKQVFNTCEEFKAYVESDVAKYREESQTEASRMKLELNGEVTVWEEEIGGGEYDSVVSGRIYDANGKLICEYEFIPHLYQHVKFTKTSHDKTPITVITYEAGRDATSVVDTVGIVLISVMAAALVGCWSYYAWSVVKIKKALA